MKGPRRGGRTGQTMTCGLCHDSGHHKPRCPWAEDYKLRQSVRVFLRDLDSLMDSISSLDRGQRIALLANDLNLVLDRTERFGKHLGTLARGGG